MGGMLSKINLFFIFYFLKKKSKKLKNFNTRFAYKIPIWYSSKQQNYLNNKKREKTIKGKEHLVFSQERMKCRSKFGSEAQLSEEDISFKAYWHWVRKKGQSGRVKLEVHFSLSAITWFYNMQIMGETLWFHKYK